MACPRNRAMNRGSGYVKPCTGDNELNNKMSQLLAERESQIAMLFPALADLQDGSVSEPSVDQTFDLAIYSFALDTYVTSKKTQALKFTNENTPDWGQIQAAVEALVQTHSGVQSYAWSTSRLRLSTYYEVAKLTHVSWGVCAVHVFL